MFLIIVLTLAFIVLLLYRASTEPITIRLNFKEGETNDQERT